MALPNTLREWENPRILPLFLFETEVPKTLQLHIKPSEKKPFHQKPLKPDILRRRSAVRSSFCWLQGSIILGVFSIFRWKGKITWVLRQETADSNLVSFSVQNDGFCSDLLRSKHGFCAPRPDFRKTAWTYEKRISYIAIILKFPTKTPQFWKNAGCGFS